VHPNEVNIVCSQGRAPKKNKEFEDAIGAPWAFNFISGVRFFQKRIILFSHFQSPKWDNVFLG
jgi:hypothetical protein